MVNYDFPLWDEPKEVLHYLSSSSFKVKYSHTNIKIHMYTQMYHNHYVILYEEIQMCRISLCSVVSNACLFFHPVAVGLTAILR